MGKREELIAQNKQLLNIQEVSWRLGVSVKTVYSWVNQRKLPHIKVGRLVKFDVADIDAWIAERKVEVFR